MHRHDRDTNMGLWGAPAAVLTEAAPASHRPAPRPAPAPARGRRVPDKTEVLTAKHKLWTIGADGARAYTPLIIANRTGLWAGREWNHCGPEDGVLVVPWKQRDDAAVPMARVPLASGAVRAVLTWREA